jgi:hypothetical protein
LIEVGGSRRIYSNKPKVSCVDPVVVTAGPCLVCLFEDFGWEPSWHIELTANGVKGLFKGSWRS